MKEKSAEKVGQAYSSGIFPGSNGTEFPLFLIFGHNSTEGWLAHINNCSTLKGPMPKGKKTLLDTIITVVQKFETGQSIMVKITHVIRLLQCIKILND